MTPPEPVRENVEALVERVDGTLWRLYFQCSKVGDYQDAQAALSRLAREVARLTEERELLREALADLHAEVEMRESLGICLPDRVPSLRAGQLLAALPREEGRTP